MTRGVSEVVRRALKRSGLSMSEVGRAAGVGTMAVCRFAKGKGMSLTNFDRLTRSLGLKLVRVTGQG